MIKDNISFTDYRALDGINWSSLKHYDRSPAHYMEATMNPMAQTKAMLIGTAVHCYILEGPEQFHKEFAIVPPCDKRTKTGKADYAAFCAENPGKQMIDYEDGDTVVSMGEAVLKHPTARKILSLCTQRELSVTWNDVAAGLECKARIDAFNPANGLVVDLKTTDDAAPGAFARTCAKYGYHGQAAYYLDGLLSAGAYAAQFLFIVVEKAAPYAVAVYVAEEEMLESGRRLVADYLARHAECLESGIWPGYPIEVQSLSLPPWA